MLKSMVEATIRNVRVTTHGRYLLRPGDTSRVVVGFHGYAEPADLQLDRLLAIPAADSWTLVSVQGLHRFYRRQSDEVVASWMTRQDRELAIADNIDYVAAVVEAVTRDAANGVIVFAGFSQGVAMAFRSACVGPHAPTAVVACGGDVPPELEAGALRRIPHVLIGRGRADRRYPDVAHERDVARLRAASVDVDGPLFDGGHEWSPSFGLLASMFLERLR